MALKSLCFVIVLFLATANALVAEDFDINKFSEVKNQKETPAKVVYLKADGSEGQKGDVDVVPAIKMELSPMPKTNSTRVELMAQIDHLVMQDIAANIAGKQRNVGVDVWASSDFKRVKNDDPNSKVDPGDFNGYPPAPPDMDFWVVGYPHTLFSLLEAGKWTHVEGKFSAVHGSHFEFHIPPGTGFIYLKNFVVKS